MVGDNLEQRNYLRVRGEYRRNLKRYAMSLGTTSACAENTAWRGVAFQIKGNYLRVRGEYRHCNAPAKPNTGTTSACAENTRPQRKRLVAVGNYLRVRGEYLLIPSPRCNYGELPPRARRILTVQNPIDNKIRTTSACAENTTLVNPSRRPTRNYLRVRGEYSRG